MVSDVTHPDNQKYLGMKLMDAAAEEDVELGRLIIDISLRDNLDAEFTTLVRRTMENRGVVRN